MRLPRPVIALLVLGLLVCGLSVPAVPQALAHGPRYGVMNTSETLPDGVWFRDAPLGGSPVRITGYGVFAGESVDLHCFAWGDAMGDHANRLWYQAHNVSRPTVAGRDNTGYLNAHFVDDGMLSNRVAPGVPSCSAAPPLPGGASLYYSPFHGDVIHSIRFGKAYVHHVRPATTGTLYKQQWTTSPRCTTSAADDYSEVLGGRRVTTLSGWSIGRMGPLYLLRGNPSRASSIRYVLLFDPGSHRELSADCYAPGGEISRILKRWLDSHPDNRLTVMAGAQTRDLGSSYVRNGRRFAHRGLQEVYFPALRGTPAAAKVTVCNYDGMRHEDVWMQFQHHANAAPIHGSCPTAPDGTRPDARWRP